MASKRPPTSSVKRRRSGEVVARRPQRGEPQAARASVRSRGEFVAGEAETKSRQRVAGEKAGEAKARRELAQARLSREQSRDDQPSSAGPRGGSRVDVGRRIVPGASKATKTFDRRVRSFLRLGTLNPRRILMIELVAVLVIVTVDQLAHQQMPAPSAYVAPFVVYLVLGFAAEVGGQGAARVATGLGALVLVALVLANAPGIVKALQVASGQRAPAQEGIG